MHRLRWVAADSRQMVNPVFAAPEPIASSARPIKISSEPATSTTSVRSDAMTKQNVITANMARNSATAPLTRWPASRRAGLASAGSHAAGC
jgi:hypothetical protein